MNRPEPSDSSTDHYTTNESCQQYNLQNERFWKIIDGIPLAIITAFLILALLGLATDVIKNP